MTRTPRNVETRINEMREIYDMEYVSPLSLPPGVAKDGYSYHWATREVRGDPVYRVEELAQKGWTLVPAERANGWIGDPLGRNPLSQKYICYKDTILMERPEIYSKNEIDSLNRRNAKIVNSLDGVSNDFGSFTPINTIRSF
jgi:hypothetical protein